MNSAQRRAATMKLLFLSMVATLVSLAAASSAYSSLAKVETLAAIGIHNSTPDKIYSSDAVDRPAKIRNFDQILPAFKKSLDCDGEGVVKTSYVLRKTGKVTDIKIENTMTCKGKEKAPNVLRRIRFTPAMKNNLRVSQSDSLEMKVEKRITIS
jgi:hypothetical protein